MQFSVQWGNSLIPDACATSGKHRSIAAFIFTGTLRGNVLRGEDPDHSAERKYSPLSTLDRGTSGVCFVRMSTLMLPSACQDISVRAAWVLSYSENASPGLDAHYVSRIRFEPEFSLVRWTTSTGTRHTSRHTSVGPFSIVLSHWLGVNQVPPLVRVGGRGAVAVPALDECTVRGAAIDIDCVSISCKEVKAQLTHPLRRSTKAS